MAVFAAIAFATFFLENDYFFTFNERSEHFAVNFGTFNGRCANFNVAVGIEQEDFVEGNGVAFLSILAEIVDIEVFTFFSFELLSFDFYNSVHC